MTVFVYVNTSKQVDPTDPSASIGTAGVPAA
jgi:hypothetical protein